MRIAGFSCFFCKVKKLYQFYIEIEIAQKATRRIRAEAANTDLNQN